MADKILKAAIDKVVNRGNLEEDEAHRVMLAIMDGQATQAQIASLITALRMKGETVEEITGFARGMRDRATKVETRTKEVVDTCGTGGDQKHTFNISTTAAFVVAGAGLAVAKHGNRSVSSKCGSADVLEALGVNLDLSPQQVGECLDEVGIAFFFAPAFHGAMKHASGPRREIGTRTIFNVLGPLTNPMGAAGQLVGVYNRDLTPILAEVLARLGAKRALVVHGLDGLDEITNTAPTQVSHLEEGRVHTYTIEPEEFGIPRGRLEDMLGGTANDNAVIVRRILEGEKGPKRDLVLLNAGAALVAGGRAKDMAEGISLASETIDRGAAYAKLEKLIAFSRSCGYDIEPNCGA